MKFNELNLSPEMSRAIADCGYTEATYIQSACIPVVMNGGDVIGQSQTGTGKTAAFAIPIIEMLEVTDRKRPQALILSPTRELAMQVCDEIRKFTKYKEGIRTVAVYGGQQISKQILELKKVPTSSSEPRAVYSIISGAGRCALISAAYWFWMKRTKC